MKINNKSNPSKPNLLLQAEQVPSGPGIGGGTTILGEESSEGAEEEEGEGEGAGVDLGGEEARGEERTGE